MRVHTIACLADNYAYLLVCETTGACAVVDPCEQVPIEATLERLGLRPTALLCTHAHADHIGGVEGLAETFRCEVVAHRSNEGRIPGLTTRVDDGAVLSVGALRVRVLHVPGHTLGSVAYHVEPGALFTGDTLFSAGCGRLFEGTAAMLAGSLARLAEADDATQVYSGHEYTASNLRFAKHVEPGNGDVDAAMERARRLRAEGKPTVPTTMGDERRTNPFLRLREPELRGSLGIGEGVDDVAAFAIVRGRKDLFR